MKKIFLLLFISFFSFKGNAQNPELFKTWYLTSIEVDLGDEIFVTNINPPISPILIINELLEFEGEGACNGFGGEFVFGEINGYDALTPTNYFETLFICDYEEHMDFEGTYFSFFQYEEPLMILNVDASHLSLEGIAGFILHYSNEPLANENYSKEKFSIYPNPVSEKLFINSENNEIEKITIYSILGNMVLEQGNKKDLIDVSSLTRGIYFVEISSSEGKTVKKFIKK